MPVSVLSCRGRFARPPHSDPSYGRRWRRRRPRAL